MPDKLTYVEVTVHHKHTAITHRIREEYLEDFTDILDEDGIDYTIYSDRN